MSSVIKSSCNGTTRLTGINQWRNQTSQRLSTFQCFPLARLRRFDSFLSASSQLHASCFGRGQCFGRSLFQKGLFQKQQQQNTVIGTLICQWQQFLVSVLVSDRLLEHS
jgi:hypothetical protein